jgi:hypothetical protein
MNELYGIDIHDNAFKLTRKKSLDFDIVEWGELVLLSAGVGS